MTTETISMTNKQIPKHIEYEAEKALSFYPELADVPIEFKLTSKKSASVMKGAT